MPTVKGVEMEGMTETIQSVRGITDALQRKETNAQLRMAARTCATVLAGQLVRAAHSSGVPVAPKVAASVRVKSDRLPVVSIGNSRVGPVMWGSERGPAGEPNRFAVPPNPGGYWIAPTVERFGQSQAPDVYKRAVYEILHEQGLV